MSQVTKTRLRSMQSTFLNVVNTQPVTDELFVSESISQVHKQEVEALPTEYAKARYLLDRVLLRGSTATLKAFIVALNKTGYHTNLQLADVLDMEGDSAQSYDAGKLQTVLLLSSLFREYFVIIIIIRVLTYKVQNSCRLYTRACC